ncbi:MAG: sulfurtransferase [Burkholderiaceae bacterium]
MPNWTLLVDANDLAMALDDCIVVDCRHDLMNPEAGRKAYGEGHIPGAYFLHQDEDLAGPMTGRNGRHPLPDRDALAARLAGLGLTPDTQLVAYDAQGGALAGRLWWLARWIGHRPVAVLDGGLPAWKAAGLPVSTDTPAPRAGGRLQASAEPGMALRTAPQLEANIASRAELVVDARAPERFRGEVEPVDPVAGHIPGAINRPLQLNLREDGRYKPAEVLRREFAELLGGRDPATVVHSCGSGVSACQNMIAMELAGLGGSALYGGSWSEWCSDPARPVATGD